MTFKELAFNEAFFMDYLLKMHFHHKTVFFEHSYLNKKAPSFY